MTKISSTPFTVSEIAKVCLSKTVKCFIIARTGTVTVTYYCIFAFERVYFNILKQKNEVRKFYYGL